jgi:hypothetical protein
MDVIVGLFWFFYLLICPVGTLVVLIGFAVKCESAIDLVLRGIPAVLILTLVLGPIWTEVGPMPWWGPRASPHLLNPTMDVKYLIWQYAAVCAGTFLVAAAIRAARARNRHTEPGPRY